MTSDKLLHVSDFQTRLMYYVRVYGASVNLEAREQLGGVGVLFPPFCAFWRLNSVARLAHQAALPVKPSCWSLYSHFFSCEVGLCFTLKWNFCCIMYVESFCLKQGVLTIHIFCDILICPAYQIFSL